MTPSWREDGHNGYVWTFSDPTLRQFPRRAKARQWWTKSQATISPAYWSSDFYAAYHHCDSPKQRCWTHLLQDIHDLRVCTPHCLPTTDHSPSSLNCHVPQRELLTRGKHFVCTITREIIKQSDKK